MKLKSTLKTSKQGFTIIELMLAMTFVATLLISIAVVTINIVSIYQRGLALKAVSNVGRSLIEELTTSINSAPAVDTTSLCNHLATGSDWGYEDTAACIKDRAYNYVYNERVDADNHQYSGVFCTGNYSYLWNTEYGINGLPNGAKTSSRTLTLSYSYRNGASIETKNIPEVIDEKQKNYPRLIRIEDRTYRVCSAFLEAKKADPSGTGNWVVNIMKEAKSETLNPISMPTEGYLSAFDLDLFLYDFTVQPISQDSVTLRTYMTGDFILATERGGIDITATGDYCQNTYRLDDGTVVDSTSSLGNLGAEFNYCAINKFNFAARTAGV